MKLSVSIRINQYRILVDIENILYDIRYFSKPIVLETMSLKCEKKIDFSISNILDIGAIAYRPITT